MNKPALVVMARAPEAGRVKTRMQPVLSPEQCAGFYEAFLRDAIDLAVSMEGLIPFLAYTPAESNTIFKRLIPAGMELIPQVGTDLGQVMDGLINTLLSRKYSLVILIGSDIPTLQPRTIYRALNMLEHADVCLGPSRDGGYYLIGAKKPFSALFQGIPWSSPKVLKVTLEKAISAGLTAALLEELSDVDLPSDLVVLNAEIRALHGVQGNRIPAWTENWLKSVRLNYKDIGSLC